MVIAFLARTSPGDRYICTARKWFTAALAGTNQHTVIPYPTLELTQVGTTQRMNPNTTAPQQFGFGNSRGAICMNDQQGGLIRGDLEFLNPVIIIVLPGYRIEVTQVISW